MFQNILVAVDGSPDAESSRQLKSSERSAHDDEHLVASR
jgi:hypothetical protein